MDRVPPVLPLTAQMEQAPPILLLTAQMDRGTVGSASAGADGSGTAGSAADAQTGRVPATPRRPLAIPAEQTAPGLTSSSDAADGTDAAASGSQSQVLISPEALNPDNTQQETTVSGSASGVRQYTIRRGRHPQQHL